MSQAFTLIDGTEAQSVQASVEDGHVTLSPKAVEDALGWQLKPEGLCRGSVCIPVRDRSQLERAGGIDLQALAAALGRPLALDMEERAAALGTPAADRAQSMASLEAPDFTLPDLEGRMHSLSEHRGKKVLLIAYASW